MKFKEFIQNNKWYILGSIGFVGVGIGVAYFISRFTKLKNPNPKKILFVGDSISDPKYSIVYPLKVKEARPDLQVDIVALGGKTTSWMLENLIPQLQNNKYDRVYIYGGINDMFSPVSVSTALSNVQKMVDLINENGADAFVLQGYTHNGYFMDANRIPTTRYVTTAEEYLPLIEKYKQYQSAIPKTIKNATIIPQFNLGDNTSDGTHPSAKGQQMIADIILKTL